MQNNSDKKETKKRYRKWVSKKWKNWKYGKKRNLKGFKVCGYALIILTIASWVIITLTWDRLESWNKAVPASFLGLFSLVGAIAVTLLSIYYSAGEWYQVFKRFKDLGIQDGEPDRKGAQSEQNTRWKNEIRRARDSIVLSGTTLSGWFVTGWDDFKVDIIDILNHVDSLQIFLLHPLSVTFDARRRDEEVEEVGKSSTSRITLVLENLKILLNDLEQHPHRQKFEAYFYEGTPLSVVWIDDTIYFATYLPRTPDGESPQLILTASGQFSRQIKKAVERLPSGATTINIDTIDKILNQLTQQGEKKSKESI